MNEVSFPSKFPSKKFSKSIFHQLSINKIDKIKFPSNFPSTFHQSSNFHQIVHQLSIKVPSNAWNSMELFPSKFSWWKKFHQTNMFSIKTSWNMMELDGSWWNSISFHQLSIQVWWKMKSFHGKSREGLSALPIIYSS